MFRGLPDHVLLAFTAFLVCASAVGAFFFAEMYRVNPAYPAFAFNVILMIPVLKGEFRGYFKRPPFVAFFAAWIVIHGLIVVGLMRWVPILYWVPLLAVELFLGYLIACALFGIPPEGKAGESDHPKARE